MKPLSVDWVIVRLAAAASAGWLLSLAFQPTGWWWLASPTIAVLLVCVKGQSPGRGFLYGTAFGAAFYVPMLDWLSAVIGGDAGLGLALYSAVWIGMTTALIALTGRLPLWWVWAPCVWVGMEALGGRVPFGGWGWGRLGFSQDASPLLPAAAWAGVPGLTFLVVLGAAALAQLVIEARRLQLTSHVVAPVAVLLLLWVVPTAIQPPTDAQSTAGPATRQVGVVQGNVPQAGLDFNDQRRAVLDNHAQQTLALADDVAAGRWPQPDFVLWPENASDIDPYRNADARALIDGAAQTIDAPLLVGAVVNDPEDDTLVYNQGIVWNPASGPGQVYTKRNLVPFGEYIPWRGALAERISRFDRVPRDFVPGTASGALWIGGTTIGDAICFDVAYDDALRDATRDGARMLVVQTNNATYNGTSQPAQQFAMSKIRAVEHGRAVAVVSTSGLSGMIGPDGTLLPGTAIGELVPGRYVVELPQRDALTLADRLGAVPEWALAGIGAVAALAGWRAGRATRGSSAANGEQSRGKPQQSDREGTHERARRALRLARPGPGPGDHSHL